MEGNLLGAYGKWAASLRGKGPGELSFRNSRFKSLAAWRKKALAKAAECLAVPRQHKRPTKIRVHNQYEHDGLHIEELSWQLPFGPRTLAVFVKPAGVRGKLPGMLALHDHGGNLYVGHQKITRTRKRLLRAMEQHQRECYGGVAWANEIARRGYGVLAHDAFLFGSRRIRRSDVPDSAGKSTEPRNEREINDYNVWHWGHESVVAKSLLNAGTTWPGMMLYDDQCALDYLCSRKDVDAGRVGCAGLSGGGTRTVYLAGMDHRIRASMAAGVITTSRDFMLNRSHMGTWMLFTPLLAKWFDFCEIYGLRAPLPTMIMNCTEDPLYTLPEMRAADRILREVFRKAKALDRYRYSFYPGGHKFDLRMQTECFNWLDKWLKPESNP